MNTPDISARSTPVGQVDGQKSPRYAGLTTFARLPRLEDVPDYDVAVVGIPFDAGVTYRPGARFGPSAIREASRLLRPYNPALDSMPFADAQVVDAGDIACNPFDIVEALGEIEAGLAELMADGRIVLALGGDHTVALPALRAAHAQHGPVALVHFDAHLDTWDTYFGAPYTHGTPFRRASEEGLIRKDRSAHVGIRGSLYDPADLGVPSNDRVQPPVPRLLCQVDPVFEESLVGTFRVRCSYLAPVPAHLGYCFHDPLRVTFQCPGERCYQVLG